MRIYYGNIKQDPDRCIIQVDYEDGVLPHQCRRKKSAGTLRTEYEVKDKLLDQLCWQHREMNAVYPLTDGTIGGSLFIPPEVGDE